MRQCTACKLKIRGVQERTCDLLDGLLVLLRLIEVNVQTFVDDRDNPVDESGLSTDNTAAERLVDPVNTGRHEFVSDGAVLGSAFIGHFLSLKGKEEKLNEIKCSLANHPVLVNE